ncbi:MAG: hypothetical protein ABI083_09850 [Lapillicoccus sp.]
MNRRTKIAASAASATLAITALGGVWLTSPANAATPSNTTLVSTTADAASSAKGEVPEGTPETPESAAASDGPGGHADPAGDVQHEGGANEQ